MDRLQQLKRLIMVEQFRVLVAETEKRARRGTGVKNAKKVRKSG